MTAATSTGSGQAMRRCPVCGASTPANDEYCIDCGSSATTSTPVATAAAPTTAAGGVASGRSGAATQQPAATAAATAAMSPCPKCGRARRPDARFCPFCGETLSSGALRMGQVLGGRYRITGTIGGGGMGAVYRAVDVNLPTREEPEGRSCAIKAILDTTDPELLAAAAAEREMLIRLDHPSIVRIYDIINYNGVPFIVMALVKGTGWKGLVRQAGGQLAPEQAVRLTLDILPAFQYLHHRMPPVVYRDFKPDNAIEVQEDDGSVREILIDLGTAVEYVPGQQVQAWGTVGYAPPEVHGVCEQTPAMDVYTIVSTLAELVGLDLEGWQQGGVPPSDQWPVPPELYDLIARGRSRAPGERFATIDELREQLEGVGRFIAGSSGADGGHGNAVVPVQSRLFTGSIGNRTTARIAALPAANTADPAAPALEQARALITAGRYTQALNAADAALAANPNSSDAHLVRAAALTNLGRNDEARGDLTVAEQQGTPATRWRSLIVEAQLAQAAGDVVVAERLYAELMRLVPGEVLPKQALADLYRNTGRYPQALYLYKRVVQADPANAEAVLGMADALVALDQPEQAITVLDRVSENAVRFVDAQLRLVELYLGRVEQEPEALNRAAGAILALGDRVQSARFYRLVGDWWYAAYRLARRKALPSIDRWPDGESHTVTDRRTLAQRCRQAYRRYLRQDPEAPDADAVLERIYLEVDEWL